MGPLTRQVIHQSGVDDVESDLVLHLNEVASGEHLVALDSARIEGHGTSLRGGEERQRVVQLSLVALELRERYFDFGLEQVRVEDCAILAEVVAEFTLLNF